MLIDLDINNLSQFVTKIAKVMDKLGTFGIREDYYTECNTELYTSIIVQFEIIITSSGKLVPEVG